MKNSIVANIIPIDITLDGFTDILFTADVGGRIWRIDLNNEAENAAAFASGGVTADLNGDTTASNRRFFNTPDIAYTKFGSHSADGQFQISIGSGYRAHPLDTRVVDRFYIINDFNVYTPPTSYTNFTEDSLADASNFDNSTKDQKNAGTFIKLTSTGEKVLSSSVTVADNVLFTTYRPADATSNSNCDADTGSTRLYQISLIDPSDSSTVDPSEERDPRKRNTGIIDLEQGGIPPNPVVLFPPSHTPPSDGECKEGEGCPVTEDPDCKLLESAIAVGAEMLSGGFTRCDQISKSYWRTSPK